MNERAAYILLVTGVALWCSLLLAPPLLMMAGTDYVPLAGGCYRCFSTVCHQYDSHSFHLGGYKLAVCSRCTAIYFGFFCGVALFPFWRPGPIRRGIRLWLAGGVPMLVDVALDLSGWHSSTIATRVLSGGWFGAVAAVILAPLVIEAVLQLFGRKTQGVAYESKA